MKVGTATTLISLIELKPNHEHEIRPNSFMADADQQIILHNGQRTVDF